MRHRASEKYLCTCSGPVLRWRCESPILKVPYTFSVKLGDFTVMSYLMEKLSKLGSFDRQ